MGPTSRKSLFSNGTFITTNMFAIGTAINYRDGEIRNKRLKIAFTGTQFI